MRIVAKGQQFAGERNEVTIKRPFGTGSFGNWPHNVRQIKTPSRESSHVVRYGDNLGGVFTLATRVSYPVEVKMKAIEMRLARVPVREVMEQLGIRNKTQLKTWMRWYRKGEVHRLEQPVGKQYSYGKGPEHSSELEKVKAENRFLKQQLDLLKKYKELERRWNQKLPLPGSNPFETKWRCLRLVHGSGSQERPTTAGKQPWRQSTQMLRWRKSGGFASIINFGMVTGKSPHSFGQSKEWITNGFSGLCSVRGYSAAWGWKNERSLGSPLIRQKICWSGNSMQRRPCKSSSRTSPIYRLAEKCCTSLAF